MSTGKRYDDEQIKNVMGQNSKNQGFELEDDAEGFDDESRSSPQDIKDRIQEDSDDFNNQHGEQVGQEGKDGYGDHEEFKADEDAKNKSFVTKTVSKLIGLAPLMLNITGKKKNKGNKSSNKVNNDPENGQAPKQKKKNIIGIPSKVFYMVVVPGIVIFCIITINDLVLKPSKQNYSLNVNNPTKSQKSNQNNNINPVTAEKFAESGSTANQKSTSRSQSQNMSAKNLSVDIDKKLESMKQEIIANIEDGNKDDDISEMVEMMSNRLENTSTKILRNINNISSNLRDRDNIQGNDSDAQRRIMELDRKNHELSLENKELSDKIASLKKKIKNIKNKYSRVNNNERSSTSQNKKLNFTGWNILGVSNGVCVFGRNENPDETVIIREGDNFMGVEIKEVDIKNEVIRTNMGSVSFDEVG